jgi:hypothetical protein
LAARRRFAGPWWLSLWWGEEEVIFDTRPILYFSVLLLVTFVAYENVNSKLLPYSDKIQLGFDFGSAIAAVLTVGILWISYVSLSQSIKQTINRSQFDAGLNQYNALIDSFSRFDAYCADFEYYERNRSIGIDNLEKIDLNITKYSSEIKNNNANQTEINKLKLERVATSEKIVQLELEFSRTFTELNVAMRSIEFRLDFKDPIERSIGNEVEKIINSSQKLRERLITAEDATKIRTDCRSEIKNSFRKLRSKLIPSVV